MSCRISKHILIIDWKAKNLCHAFPKVVLTFSYNSVMSCLPLKCPIMLLIFRIIHGRKDIAYYLKCDPKDELHFRGSIFTVLMLFYFPFATFGIKVSNRQWNDSISKKSGNNKKYFSSFYFKK